MTAEDRVDEAVNCLESGGVVLLPTDTVYGLAVSPLHPAAVSKLYCMKKRPEQVKLPVMVCSLAMLKGLGAVVSPAAERLLNSGLVPGALTVAVGLAEAGVASWLAGRDEVAVRIPDDAPLLSILARTGPLLVTSANAHGEATPETMAEALAQLDPAPDLAIDGGPRQVVPSTLVNCRLDPPVVEREGAVPAVEIQKELG
jgi:L-threonylcarbamoyladenylate synthase